MQDDVYNRALFRRKSEAARNKLREMAGVDRRMPQGIMASSQELMAAALPRAMTPQMTGAMPNMMAPQMRPAAPPMAQAPLPNIVPGMFPQPMPMQQPQMPMQQPPVGFQMGGDVSLEPYNPARDMRQAVDITATPTPRERVNVPDISTLVRQKLGDNEEAQRRFTELEGVLTDPEATNKDRQTAITGAAGVENTRDGLRSVVSQITGRDIPASTTVDELNQAIMGVSLGGAIGGPDSVAERISQALLTGLDAQRQTAMGREQFEQQLSLQSMRGSQEVPKGFLETPRGKAAVEMYQNFLQNQNMTPEQAYARMDQISPGLGAELGAAMAGAFAAQPREDKAQLLQEAREAIAGGYDRNLIVQALIDAGVDPAEL